MVMPSSFSSYRLRTHHPVERSMGFALIEVLVVIVVIAILATISVIVYNGIQNRARIASIGVTVKQYATILELYTAKNGGTAPPGSWNCIGGNEGMPAENGYEAGYCAKPSNRLDNPSLPEVESAIASITPSPPSPILPEIQYNSTTYVRGMFYDGHTNSFNQGRAVIQFYIPGAQAQCPAGAVSDTYSNTFKWTRCNYRLATNQWGT